MAYSTKKNKHIRCRAILKPYPILSKVCITEKGPYYGFQGFIQESAINSDGTINYILSIIANGRLENPKQTFSHNNLIKINLKTRL